MKIIIFGTGNYYEKFKYRFRNEQIVALADNNKNKIGTVLDGYKIIDPNCIKEYNFDKIVILVSEYEPIKQQLFDMGIYDDTIITVDNMGIYKKYRTLEIMNVIPKKSNKESILLVSHGMSMTGAPLMLLNLGRVLVEQGYNVSVISSQRGELCNYFIQNNIEVIYVDEFDFDSEDIEKYFSIYDLIIVNTLIMWRLIEKLNGINCEVIWWIHEDIIKIPKESAMIGNNIHVFGVGNRAINAWKQFAGKNAKIQNLCWGIDEVSNRLFKNNSEQCIFAVIGYVDYIKGQDILIRVLEKNKDIWNNKIQVWFIGEISEEEKHNFEKIPFVKCFGEVPHKEVMELYDEIDGIISTSRHDTMSVVLVEGMMKHLVCLSSSATGVSDYIIPYKNGLVFKSEDELDLEDKIQWMIDNKVSFDEIGENAFNTYKEYFSIEKFKHNVITLLKRYMP